jgi:hypothetical protein
VHHSKMDWSTSVQGQTRRLICLGMSASPPTPDVSLRRSEPTLWARRDDFQHIPNESVSAVAGGSQ